MSDFVYGIFNFWFKKRYGIVDLIFIYFLFRSQNIVEMLLIACMWIITGVLLGGTYMKETIDRLKQIK